MAEDDARGADSQRQHSNLDVSRPLASGEEGRWSYIATDTGPRAIAGRLAEEPRGEGRTPEWGSSYIIGEARTSRKAVQMQSRFVC